MTQDKNNAVTTQPKATSLNPIAPSNGVATPSMPDNASNFMTVEMQRSIAETHAAYQMAMMNPRNQALAVDKMLNECQRPTLAEKAVYSYPRGGAEVTGPSIRLAEAIKRNWGHIKSGWRVLSRSAGSSEIQAYALDLQSGVMEEKVFTVKHERSTKKGSYVLTDERDIYELQANQASRRVRSCILALIPSDVIEACLEQCEMTLENSVDIGEKSIKNLVEGFRKHGVNVAMLESRLGRRISSMNKANYLSLVKIGNSLKDEMSTPATWFDMSLADKVAQDIEEKESSTAKSDKGAETKAKPETLEDLKQEHAETLPEENSKSDNPAGDKQEPEPEKKPEDCPVCEGRGEYEEIDEETGETFTNTCGCQQKSPPVQESMV